MIKDSKDFIEKAIKGGWKQSLPKFVLNTTIDINNIFLDPLAWQAVGKVEGWRTRKCEKEICIPCNDWKYAMHRMIDALAEGKSVEQFLQTL